MMKRIGGGGQTEALGSTGCVNVVHASRNKKMSRDMALDTEFTATYTSFAIMLATAYTATCLSG
jgi:hypothetical protein